MRPKLWLAALSLALPALVAGAATQVRATPQTALRGAPASPPLDAQKRHGHRLRPIAAPSARELSKAVALKRDPDKPAEHVVLVVLDGVKWQDVFGLTEDASETMPTLQKWMNVDGAVIGAPGVGAPMQASGPNFVSLPGYVEILTGRPSMTCQQNECVLPPLDTFADEVPTHSAIVSSWEAIGPIVRSKTASVTAGRHYRRGSFDAPTMAAIDRAKDADPFPGTWDYRPDALTAEIALDVLRREEPAFLFVGLGETDEWAHRGDREGYLAAMRAADAFLERLDETLRDEGMVSSTTVIVTTDHGRADSFRDHGWPWPESKRVWLVAKGAGIEARGAVEAPERRLSSVAPTIRRLLGVVPSGDEGPPLMELLGERP